MLIKNYGSIPNIPGNKTDKNQLSQLIAYLFFIDMQYKFHLAYCT